MCFLALRERDRDRVNSLPPAVGLVGASALLPLLFRHLYTSERGTFYAVVLVAAVAVTVELLYFERDVIEAEIEAVEPDLSTPCCGDSLLVGLPALGDVVLGDGLEALNPVYLVDDVDDDVGDAVGPGVAVEHALPDVAALQAVAVEHR